MESDTSLFSLHLEDNTDPGLPGLHTRLSFQEKIADETALWSHFLNAERRPQGLPTGTGLLLFRLNHIELLKSLHGEDAGNLALRHLARLLLGHIRAEDMVVRWGEWELLTLLPRIESDRLPAVAEKIRAALRSRIFQLGDQKATALSVSVGTSFLGPSQRGVGSWQDVIAAAESALAALRRAGWNARPRLTLTV